MNTAQNRLLVTYQCPSIRNFISTNSFHALKMFFKSASRISLNILLEEIVEGRDRFGRGFYAIITSLLRRMKTGQIKDYPYVSEGLEKGLPCQLIRT